MISKFQYPVSERDIAVLHRYMKRHALGSKNARKSKVISRDLGYQRHTNSAPLRAVIRAAVLKGIPIVGTQRGFYLAARQSEVDSAVKSLRYRANQIRERFTALEEARV